VAISVVAQVEDLTAEEDAALLAALDLEGSPPLELSVSAPRIARRQNREFCAAWLGRSSRPVAAPIRQGDSAALGWMALRDRL
jgi:hypothetical protein